jgi:hypothetical protein
MRTFIRESLLNACLSAGIIAHQSGRRGGELIKIIDYRKAEA